MKNKIEVKLISSIEVGSTDESENKRIFLKVEEGLKRIYNIVYFEFLHYNGAANLYDVSSAHFIRTG